MNHGCCEKGSHRDIEMHRKKSQRGSDDSRMRLITLEAGRLCPTVEKSALAAGNRKDRGVSEEGRAAGEGGGRWTAGKRRPLPVVAAGLTESSRWLLLIDSYMQQKEERAETDRHSSDAAAAVVVSCCSLSPSRITARSE